MPKDLLTTDCQFLAQKALPFTLIDGLFHRSGIDMINCHVLQPTEVESILKAMHSGVVGGHFSEDIRSRKILDVGY